MASLTFLPGTRLEPRADEVLAAISDLPWSDDFYLAGSSALHLYVGHRQKGGLDLMAGGNRLTPQNRRDLMADLLDLEPSVEVETARDGYLFARFGDGIVLKFFYYPYPLVDAERSWRGMAVASALDLALMKLGAIISRGTRQDFVDLYLLSERLPLAEVLPRAEEKFGHVRDFPLQALKGLSDLSLAQGEPMPRLDRDLGWHTVEAWVAFEVQRLGRIHLGIPSQDGGL